MEPSQILNSSSFEFFSCKQDYFKMLQSSIKMYDEDAYHISIHHDLLCSKHSLSSSSAAYSPRASSSSTDNSLLDSSKNIAPKTVSVPQPVSRSASSSKRDPSSHPISRSASSARPSSAYTDSFTWASYKTDSTGQHIYPVQSPCRGPPLSNHHDSGEKVVWGNIRPSGYDPKMGTGFTSSTKTRVLSFGKKDYGYGSIIDTSEDDIEEMVRSGNNALRNGKYKDALEEFDKVIRLKPNNIDWRIYRADTLVELGRFEEALMEYFVAHDLDPTNGTLHCRMSVLQLRLGVVDIAEQHMIRASPEWKEELSAKIDKVKNHLIKGGNARRNDNWKTALREVNAVIEEGVDSCQSILAFKAEMLLRLNQLDQAEKMISKAFALESKLPTLVKFLGMIPEAYICVVHAQIEMALGRFDDAFTAADKAHKIDQFNAEVSAIKANVRMTRAACVRGNRHYIEGDYLRACDKYMVGLKYAKYNISLLTNLAACHWKLETWDKCLEICNLILQFQPGNTKALLRRADSYAKLEKWAECVSDFEEAAKTFPKDAKLAEALRNAQVALKESQVEDVLLTESRDEDVLLTESRDEDVLSKESQDEDVLSKESQLEDVLLTESQAGDVLLKESQLEDVLLQESQIEDVLLKEAQVEDVTRLIIGSEVKEITTPKQFREAISTTGASIAFFYYQTNNQCIEIFPYVDSLCRSYPSVNFVKVDIRECPSVADAEKMHLVPSFAIYRKGLKITEMFSPRKEELASWIEHYV